MTKKRNEVTIADVLHRAADKNLLAHDRYRERGRKEKFSCCAVDDALYELTGSYSSPLRSRVMAGLRNMGVNTGNSNLFKKYGDKPDQYSNINHEVQGMRYFWLKWAALMAEEQGV